MSKKRVAIIGAGASGLAAIKCCNDEGLEPVCFERTTHIGGLWYYSEDVTDGQGSVTKTTVTNTSKEIMCYSDFPIPKEFPNYMHNTKLLEYYRLFAKNFNLEKYIKFNIEISKVAKADDFATSGKWNLDVLNKTTGETKTETFDFVMLCTGHHADKHIPRFEGDDVFKGKIIHSSQYRSHRGFEDKNVVIVGLGDSAIDTGVDLSRISKQVYLSTRTGTWVFPRVAEDGLPIDVLGFRRFAMAVQRTLPSNFMMTMVESKINRTFNHTTYGLRPKHRVFEQHPIANGELPNRIINGSVIIKPDVKRFTETGVEFKDGTVVEADVIVLATGYVFGFPYIEKGIIEVVKNKVELFKYVFPPEMEQPTLAVIGCIQPLGAVNPVSEMQSRWATRVFKGIVKLPSKSKMWANIRLKQVEMAKKYVASQRYTIQIDYIPFMDELAEQFGCRPNIGAMLFRDPKLALASVFGPWSPCQYRLEGPGKWEGAREAILTINDRVMAPFKTRQAEPESSSSILKFAFLVLILAVLVVWLL